MTKKMVSTVSAASHTSEMEKKRKHTLGRAQANHLSRQLQMRLQYARLKVEHGWQRQNLNEVENLYFHHAHQRGSNSYIPSSTLTPDQRSLATTTRNIDSPFKSLLRFQSECLTLDTSSENSSTAKKLTLGPAAVVTPQTTLTSFGIPYSLETQIDQQSQDPITSAQTPITDSQVLSSVQSIDSDTDHLPAAESIPASKEPQHSRLSLSQHTLPTPTLSYMTEKSNFIPTPLISTPPTLSKMYPVPHISKLTSTTNSFNPTSLTYDSFWSGIQSKFYPLLQSGPVVTPELAVDKTSNVTSSEHNQAAISSLISASSAIPTFNLTSPSTPSLLPISAQSQPSPLSTTSAALLARSASTSPSPSSVSAPMPLA